MAALQDLIAQISDPVLRDRIATEADKLTKSKKFGLVFEEHIPECIPLYGFPIRVGTKVAKKTGYINDIYTVTRIAGDDVTCIQRGSKEETDFKMDDIVAIAEFGEPIYPYLQPVDSICNAPDDPTWHTLIEADNYHALQLLEYLYAGKVDCIYIDPPYNTGARDWKYNNDYVDSSDSYRHSKWLSMMEKRLKIAKKLLNPDDSVLIVTIDEKEYLHLGCLLEELFSDARIQMISIANNMAGVQRVNEFSRVDEYAFFVMYGDAGPQRLPLGSEWIKEGGRTHLGEIRWDLLRRTGTNASRSDSPGCFYPILISSDGKKIIGTGDTLQVGETYVNSSDDAIAILPIRQDGTEGRWQINQATFKEKLSKGLIKLGPFKAEKTAVYYLKPAEEKKLYDGTYAITGYREDGSVITSSSDNEEKISMPTTQWRISAHDSTHYGTRLIKKIIPGRAFSFPKSLYATHDAIRFVTENKPDALIVDFFAGSGTTLHAVNLLNAEDGGHRRCIMVTNNEVSDDEAKTLTKQGYKPGDDEWEKYGIARYVTWPRTVCSIKGIDINGRPLTGEYIGSDTLMSNGFKSNAAYFKLGFLDKSSVELGRQFARLLSVLWMKAGSYGACPELDDGLLPDKMILPENKFAVLLDERKYSEFEREMEEHGDGIETIYFVTDSETAYRAMTKNYSDKKTYQLYKNYLDNFRINMAR